MGSRKIKGFTGADDRAPRGRGMEGVDKVREDGSVDEHDDLRADFGQGLQHRELNKSGKLNVGVGEGGATSAAAGESGQRVRPYEERVQRASIAGVLVRAAKPSADTHYARNSVMDKASDTTAIKPWKPQGRGEAAKVSRNED